MKRSVLKILSFLITLLVIFVLSRSLIRALPGDPFETLLAETGTTVDPIELKQELGLHLSWNAALARDAARLWQGEWSWGSSLLKQQPIFPLIQQRIAVTWEIASLTLIMGLSLSLLLGLSAGSARFSESAWSQKWGETADRLCTTLGLLAAALPTPWIGPVLIYLLAVKIPIFELGESPWLPAMTLSIGFVGIWSRLIREQVQSTLGTGNFSSASNAARARGLPEWKIQLKYGLAPAGGSLLAYLGTHMGGLLSGVFVTEMIFNRPGIGMLLVESVLSRDYPVVEASIFFTSAIALFFTHLGDWAREWVDPRRSQWKN